MFAKLSKWAKENSSLLAVGCVAVSVTGVLVYKVLNPPPTFKDSSPDSEDSFSDQLNSLAAAIHDAGAANLFFTVEAMEIRKNFERHAQPASKKEGVLVLTHKGFVDLMQSMTITDTRLLDRIFFAWDRDGSGELDFVEFLQAITLCLTGSSSDKLAALFGIIDSNGDGVISRVELERFFTNMYTFLGKPKTEQQIESQISELFETMARESYDPTRGLNYDAFREFVGAARFAEGESFDDFLSAVTETFTRTLGDSSSGSGGAAGAGSSA